MVLHTAHGGVCSQLCDSFSNPENSILSHDGIWTLYISSSQQDLPSQSGERTLRSLFHSQWCHGCSPSSPAENERVDCIQVHSMEGWRESMAGNDQHSYGRTQETPNEANWSIWNWRSHLTNHLPTSHPSRWKIHLVFHASLLTTYKETVKHGPNFLQPPPDLIDGEEEYKVKVVIGHQGKPGWWTFLIQWKGYSAAEDSWEPEQNLGNTKSLIEEYKITQPKDFPEYNHHSQKWTPPSLSSSSASVSLWPFTLSGLHMFLAGLLLLEGTQFRK